MSHALCPHCGASLKEWWQPLNKGLVGALIKFREAVIRERRNDINPNRENLSHNEKANFQKLRFHALVARVKEDDAYKKGRWLLTHRGALFLSGKIAVPKRVRTFRNRVIAYDTEKIFIRDIYKLDIPVWDETFQFELAKPEGELAGSKEVQLELFN